MGLEPVSEFTQEAESAGIKVFAAGDAAEIAEASSAMFSGKIAGLKIAGALGKDVGEIPKEWDEKVAILKSKPGPPARRKKPKEEEGGFPVFQNLPEPDSTQFQGFCCQEHILDTGPC